MAVKQVAIRLKPEGGAEVTAAFKSAEEAGVRAGSATAAAADKAAAAAARQEAQWRRNAEAMQRAANAADAQARFNAALGVGGTGSSAAASADVFAAAFRAEEDAARKANALRAQIDPAGAALDRLNGELREYELLAKRGAISSTELAKAQQLARTRYDEATAALARNTGGLTRNQLASRLNLARQGADVLVTGAMGMNPAMIAIQQGPQILDAWATSGLKARGSMLLLGGAIGVMAGAAAVGAKAMWDAEQAALALDRAATGMGRTAGLSAADLEEMAVEGAKAGELTASAAREATAAWVSTGRIGEEVIPGLLAMVKDYAAFTGQDAKAATEDLAKAMLDPARTAREWSIQTGLLDKATRDHIDSLVEQGDLTAAQKVLLEALTDAVDGHADKVARIETAWGGVARAAAGAYEWIKDVLTLTETEQVEALESHLRSLGKNPDTARFGAPGMEGELAFMRVRGTLEDWAAESKAETAARNQAEALEEARQERLRNRPRGGGRSAAAEAERAAREALQRQRAEEDRAHQLELEVARLANDADRIRVLEEEAAIRTRIRQLVDDDVSAEDARFKALSEQARLNEARALATEREVGLLFEANSIEVDRILGMDRFNAEIERELDLRSRIKAYQETELDLAEATKKAKADQLLVDEARAEVLQRSVDAAAREHALTLARLSGRRGDYERLSREARIERRAREIEGDPNNPLNYGEGVDRAAREIGEEIAAEAEGGMRDGFKSLIADIRQGGLADALADQFDRAVDRMIDHLIDALFDADLGGALSGGKGKSGGGGGWLGSLLGGVGDFLFGGGVGRNAAGTDYWRGGLTWVGEEGPELAWLPRGSKVASHGQSMRMMAQAAAAPLRGGDTHNHFYLDNATIGSDELWRRIERGDQLAARAGASRGASVAVQTVHGTAPAVQHSERMMRS